MAVWAARCTAIPTSNLDWACTTAVQQRTQSTVTVAGTALRILTQDSIGMPPTKLPIRSDLVRSLLQVPRENCVHLRRRLIPGEKLCARQTHCRTFTAQVLATHQLDQHFGQVPRILSIDIKRGLTAYLRQARHPRGDCRDTTSHRFQYGQPKTFVEARVKNSVGTREQGGKHLIRDITTEEDPFGVYPLVHGRSAKDGFRTSRS